MAGKGLSLAGFHVFLSANRRVLTLSLTISNRLWQWIYRKVRQPVSGRGEAAPSGTSLAVELQDVSGPQAAILERVRQIEWYHSIDLGQGIVTPGMFDHRPLLDEYGLPEQLQGKRVLDVATWDGFWAHEFRKRGAEVVAMDIPYREDVDLTPATRARIEKELSKEELTERTGKGFDMEYLSWYRDCVWWKFSLEALQNMIIDAGFEHVELKNTYKFGKRGEKTNLHHAVIWAFPPGSAALSR